MKNQRLFSPLRHLGINKFSDVAKLLDLPSAIKKDKEKQRLDRHNHITRWHSDGNSINRLFSKDKNNIKQHRRSPSVDLEVLSKQ